MSYIIKRNQPLINLKLTDNGRRLLSVGALNFSGFGLGDSEVDYTNDNLSLENILRPTDNNHDIMYPVPSDGSNYISSISILNSIPTIINTSAKERGFFNVSTTGITLNSNLTSLYNLSGTGSTLSGNTIVLKFDGNSKKNVIYNTIKTGDYLFIKLLEAQFYSGHTQNYDSKIEIDPTQYLWYIVNTINNSSGVNLTGITSGTTLTITLDRDLPNFSSDFHVKGFVYPGSDTIQTYYDSSTPIAYWSGGLLDFTSNCTLSTLDVPVWNMTIIYPEDLIGVDSTVYKGKELVKSKNYLGTAINYGYLDKTILEKIGVIHYTNNTVSNFYGEGFYNNTLTLNIPYLMWHKKQFNGAGTADKIGYTFICDSTLKFFDNSITNETVPYYDLIDQEINPTIVGKVLINQKIIIIEHPELLSVLSFKGNRNWTLPKPVLTLVDPGHCQGSNILGSLQSQEEIHITYLFSNSKGITGIQCEDYTTLDNTSFLPKDVLFQFPQDSNNPLYSEFSYLKDFNADFGSGYTINDIQILWQKTVIGGKPDPSGWHHFDANAYLGTNGCLSHVQTIGDTFELHSDSFIYASGSTFSLTDLEVGDVIVSVDGVILKEATSAANVGVDGDFYKYPLSVTLTTRSVIKINTLILTAGDVIQFNYLIGSSNTAKTIRQQIDVPSSGIPGTNTYLNGIYIANSKVNLTLTQQPNNDVVYLFYNGQLISSNNYGVYPTGTTAQRRVVLNFTPANGSQIILFYLDNSGLGLAPNLAGFLSSVINNLRIYIDSDNITQSENTIYDLNDHVSIPTLTNSTKFSFGDENFFFGNIKTDIKATVYKTLITCNVLPNQFISSTNPTFNSNRNKVSFSEIGIYDNNNDLVAIGKFSEPLHRKYNSDIMVIQATMDF